MEGKNAGAIVSCAGTGAGLHRGLQTKVLGAHFGCILDIGAIHVHRGCDDLVRGRDGHNDQ